jgi:serine/threonine protein kinase/DNA-binding NarL/FixJ family response regulator
MKKKILLVEYANSTIEIIKEVLSHSIFEITIANEGDTAKQYLAQENFDMMITAAMLPKFHGFSLSLYAAQNNPGIKIIITSQIYKGMEYRHQATNQYKADDFFEIPFDKSTLKRRIYELLGIDESSVVERREMRTTQIPISDTNKIPTLDKLAEEQKKLTSDDLFGDIIDQVDQIPTYEIKLNDDASPKKPATAKEPPITKPIKTKPETVEIKQAPKSPGVTREMVPPVTQVMKKAPSTSPPPQAKSSHIPPVTQVMKKSPGIHSADKADLDLLELLKPKAKPAKAGTGQKPKYKKIEDDISKKFEETLSGLGINKKKTGPKSNGPDSTQKIDLQQLHSKTPDSRKDSNEELVGYEVLGRIGRGGMAEIFKAKKKGVKGFEKVIALKKILSGYGEDAKYIEMFVDEAKIAAQLTHPNIVHIYDLGKKDDYYFIAMEYVRGKDLRLILQQLSQLRIFMPEELAIYLTIKVLEALSYAHSARDAVGKPLDIVHRDVSPPNILVSYDGNVKLTDFGVSKASIKMHQTLAGALKGKLLYMSPEQASGNEDIDFRSDLYSVGIILYELLTRQKVFMDSSEILTLQKVQEGKVTRPSHYRKDIDPQLEAIVMKSLTKDINKRYQKASEMIRDLDSYMAKNYQNSPESGHITHLLYTLFKEEIVKEGIDIHLTPIANPIKKVKREQTTLSAPPTPPPPKPELPKAPPEPITSPKGPVSQDNKEISNYYDNRESIEFDENNENNENNIFDLQEDAKMTEQLPPKEIEELEGPPTAQLPPEAANEDIELLESDLFNNKITEAIDPPPFPETDMDMPEELPSIDDAIPETRHEIFPETVNEEIHEAVQEVKPIKEEETFQPIIEINFDDDDIPETLPPEADLPQNGTDSEFEKATPTDTIDKSRPETVPLSEPFPQKPPAPPTEDLPETTPEPVQELSSTKEFPERKPQSEVSIFADIESSEDKEKSQKRRNLLLALLGVIVILAVIIAFLLMGGDSSENERPEASPGSSNKESTATLPQPAADGESLPAAAGDDANLGKDTQQAAVDPTTASLKQQKLEAGKTLDTESQSRESISKESSKKKKDNAGAIDKTDIKSKSDNQLKKDKDKKSTSKKNAPETESKTRDKSEPTAADKEKLVPSSTKSEKKASKQKSADESETEKAETSKPTERTPQTQPEVKLPAESKVKTETNSIQAQPEKPALKEGDILPPSEVDTQPVAVNKQKIKINRNLRRLLTNDERIFITYLVEHDGTVQTVKLLKKSSIKKINSSIINTVKKWKFKPATKNKVRVKIWKNQWIVIKK